MKAAGSTSAIEIEFVAVNRAGAVSITAISPAGFDFNNCSVTLPQTIDNNYMAPATIVVRAAVAPGKKTKIVISGVKLASTGGVTVFSITTMRDSAAGPVAKR